MFWFQSYSSIPKTHRYTLAKRIDTAFIEMIEGIAAATYLQGQEKDPYIRLAIRKLDTAKILLLILWETRSFTNKQYITLSEHLEEVGKMLGGWHGHVRKQNSSGRPKEKRRS